MPMMNTAGYFCSSSVSRCLRGRSGNIARISSAWKNVSASGSGGWPPYTCNAGYAACSIVSAPLMTFQIRRTVSLR